MTVSNIAQIGESCLREKSKEVENFSSSEVKQIIDDLTDTMRTNDLVGMAAPQIRKNLRIIVIEVRKTKYRNPEQVFPLKIFINPIIACFSKEKSVGYEGCGSVISTQIFGPVLRSEKITIMACDDKHQKFTIDASGLLARAIQHEYDHLDGILFTDKLTDPVKLMSRAEYLKMRQKQITKK